MNQLRYLTFLLLSLAATPSLLAREFIGDTQSQGTGNTNNTNNTGGYRASCIASRAETDLNINNVRARLRSGGDVWWNGNIARYIVPNVDPASGKPEVSALFAGAIWLGGYTDGGNLIVAAQTYRQRGNDFWSGPLNPANGQTDKTTCENWDRHFRVLGADIDALRSDFLFDGTVDARPSRGLLGWPAKGNPHFASIYGFALPDQDLAPFIDANNDDIYDPMDGDHPIIEVVDCPGRNQKQDYNNPIYADEMIWWVYNDNGNLHTQTSGAAMQMEVQALAFGYRTTNAINNMTFYRYKLLNRNDSRVVNTYFSLWSDPDLGCSLDDYIGCDTSTNMGYVYNADANDNATCGSGGGGLGYGTSIPALAVDYFRGPLDSAGNQIGLSSFQYHVNQTGPTGDPNSALGYYRLQSGFWPDGTPVTFGGTGYNVGSSQATKFVFPSFPNDQSANAWSMCHGGTTGAGDFRFLHTSGPFTLLPGATNELISGVVWVPDLPDYPCPSLRQLVDADVLAQNLFDNCFKITDGPDAPFIDVVEMENELVLNLSYVSSQNNYELGYEESPADLRSVTSGTQDSTYNFEGYKIYQVISANTSVTDLEDPTKARLIYQTDVRNGVNKIANWSVFDDEDISAVVPTIMVEGEDKGIKHSFQVIEDKFSTSTDKKLINHKPYYFCVVAYAYNQYTPYDYQTNSGQATPYLQGRRNFRIYTGIPRNNSPEYYGAKLNAKYGNGPEITRVDGRGNGGGLFLNFANQSATETDILAGTSIGRLTYAAGQGPLNIKIVDPLRVPKGTYQLYIGDRYYVWSKDTATGVYTPMPPTNSTTLRDSLYWVMKDISDPTKIWYSYMPLTFKYEQYVPEFGLSFSIEQIPLPGTQGVSGWIGSSIEYTDSTNAVRWYNPVLDASSGQYNVLKTGNAQDDATLDPSEDYSTSVAGFHPVNLCDCKYRTDEFYFSPNEINSSSNSFCRTLRLSTRDSLLSRQRNVNVVVTPDKSKWSRCIVLESGNEFHTVGLSLGTLPSGVKQLYWKRNKTSVDKDGNAETGSTGYSWFPGYAYDVETGERLNVLFAENSFLDGSFFDVNTYPKAAVGNDMIYNPTDLTNIGFGFDNKTNYISKVLGGQHMIYVANSRYDSCRTLVNVYNMPETPLFTSPYRILQGRHLIWASLGYMQSGTSMQGAKQNTPPSEVTFKLRVSTPYNIWRATNSNQGYPQYEFTLDGLAPTKQSTDVAKTALDLINIVPNPYYAYSDYEVTEVDNAIKITNLPPKCDIRIYSIDGRFVRQFTVAQSYPNQTRNGIARLGENGNALAEAQATTSLNWNLKNAAGVPVASGVYLVHVVVPGVGERVLKSFIINRTLDAQKL